MRMERPPHLGASAFQIRETEKCGERSLPDGALRSSCEMRTAFNGAAARGRHGIRHDDHVIGDVNGQLAEAFYRPQASVEKLAVATGVFLVSCLVGRSFVASRTMRVVI